MKNKKLLLYIFVLISFTQIIHAQVPTYVPTNGLVGYWPFNGNVNDESGNGNNGTVNGATLTTDRNGNANSAYSFDGNDLISILNSPSFNFGTTNNFTMSLWFKRQSTSDEWDVLLSYSCPDEGGGGGLQLGTTTNFHLEFGSSGAEFFDGGNVNDTSWHMLTVTFDRVIDIVKIYQDGEYVSNINVPNTYTYSPTCNSNILIGGERNYWPQYYFNGLIDDIAIYNRALTQEEIIQLYTATPAPTEVAIGTQTWATKNLDVDTYSDGTLIPEVNDPTEWANSTTGAWCYYNNDSANGAIYGKLYNWYAVAGIWNEASKTDASQRKKLAPTGYHVPTDAELNIVTDLKAPSGFSGLPGGYRDTNGPFNNISLSGTWWSFSEYNATNAWSRELYYNAGNTGTYNYIKTSGFSLRCIKDTTSKPTATAQTFCTTATVASLVATGTDLKWYATASGGTALDSNVALTSGTYYVSQTINTIESTRTAVTFAVNDAQITASATTVCSGTAVTIAASSTVAGNSSLPANLQNGLVGYWPFNGNANDASGNGNNGTVNGATLTTDRFGNSNGAYSFDGNNFISTNITPSNISQRTYSAWFKTNTGGAIIGSNSANNTSNLVLAIHTNGTSYGNEGTALWVVDSEGSSVGWMSSLPTNNLYNDNLWHNITGVFNSISGNIISPSNLSLYVDGVLITIIEQNVNPTISPINILNNIVFGYNKRWISNGYGVKFDGVLDDISIWNRPLSTAEIQQLYIQGQTTYLWSTGETNASINPTPTATTTYWCDITANGVTCRKEMTISIPTITSHPSNANLCATVGASTSISIQDNIPNANYTWQYRVVTAANLNPTWTNISSSNASNVYANYTTATLTITKTTSLPAIGTQYRVVVAGNCGISVSNPANLTIISTIKAGTIVSAATVCLGGNITLTLSAFIGTSFQWQSAPISTTTAPGVFTDIPGATSTSYTITSATADINKSYRVVVANSCYGTTAISPIKTIKVDPTSVGGTVKGGGTVCSLGGGTLSLTGYVGKIQWQYSTDGGATYVNAPSATVGTSSNFTTTSATSIAATYVVANVSSNTLFRALVTSGVCSSSASNSVEFVLGTQAVAGTISAQASTICAASGTTLTLSGNLGSIVWQKSTNWTAATPTWSAVSTSVTPTLNTGALSATTAFRAKVTIGLCSTVYTDVTVITVSPTAKGGTVAVNVAGTDVCSGSSKAMKVTGNVGTIQWQMSTTSATAGFVDVAGATTTPYTFTNITQPTWFRVVATSGVCTTTSASNAIGITVSTTPAVAGTISGVNSVCTATGSTLSLDGSTGSIVWQKAVAPFTSWATVTGATTSSLATGNLTATTAYRAILTSGTCKAMTDAYTVTVSPAARATAISGNALVKTLATAICTSTTAPLTLATGSIGTIEWQYYFAGSSATSVTNTSVVTWTPIVGATSAVYNASSNQAGNVWFRIKFTSGPCSLNAFSTPVNVWFKNCSIAKIETQNQLVKTTFAVVAYPNPYSENFNLSLTTSSEDKVGVMVYDMTGKLIEQHEVRLSEVSALHVGDRYPSGVYNVIVTQGQEYKTLRVVKR